MSRRIIFVGTILLQVCAAARGQQSDLAELISKTQFTKDDDFNISQYLERQARALSKAKSERDRQAVRTAVLKWVEDAKATGAFKNRYATLFVTSDTFGPLIGSPDRETALAAVLILSDMPFAGARDGFTAALTSSHPAVRYWGAKGLAGLRGVLKKPADCGPALQALGAAGASEAEPLVLKLIYEAIDYGSAGGDFAGQDEVANALNAIFDARLAALQGGARPEIDRPGFALAAAVYPKLANQAAIQKELVRNLGRFLAYGAARYSQLGPKGGGVGLKDTVKACEDALATIARAAGATPPPEPQRMAAKIAAGGDVKAVQGALAGWIGGEGKPGVLNGEPWKLPIGL